MERGQHHTIDVTGLPPEAVGAVESLVGILRRGIAPRRATAPSIFSLFGKAKHLRTAEDIARQLRQEKDAWGEA